MSSVEIKNLNKSFGTQNILYDISFAIPDGEFVALVGPSGCGKSTILRLLAGLEEITSGEILIDNNVINEVESKNRDIAMVFQNYALYPHMNVADNMGFSLRLLKKPKNEILKKVSEVAEVLGISELLKRYPKQLSGGQRQRVAMGRAIVRQPKVFLFDEPLSNLDAALRAEMRVEISRLHQKIKTNMIYVTHDQVEAMTLADRIVILNNGNIEQVGTPNEIYTNPDNIFVAQFIGTPKMNIFKINSENIVSNNKINILGNSISFSGINLDKKNYYIGIRPEHLTLNENQEFNFTPKIELIENLGNEKIVYMVSENNQLCAKISSDIQINNTFGFNLKNVLLFDENGLRIRY